MSEGREPGAGHTHRWRVLVLAILQLSRLNPQRPAKQTALDDAKMQADLALPEVGLLQGQ